MNIPDMPTFKVTVASINFTILIENNMDNYRIVRNLYGTDDTSRFVHNMNMYQIHTVQKPTGQWWVTINPVENDKVNEKVKAKIKLTVMEL